MPLIIDTLAQLAEFQATSGPGKLVFRGQGDATWGLVPSIYRGMDSLDLTGWENEICDRERDIFREFTDRSRRFREGGSPWEVLVTAQHYGTPTRLLDWTKNAQAALYFACASTPSSDGALWCAKPANVPVPEWIGRIHDGLGFRKERLERYIPERDLPFCIANSKSAFFGSAASPPPLPHPTFDQNGALYLSGLLTFFIPPHVNDRIAAQVGLFSVYISRNSTEEIVADHEAYLRAVEHHSNTHILDKIIIPASAKEHLLASLQQVGVDATSIYPDLYGLGLHLSFWQRHLAEEVRRNPIS